MDYVPSHGNTMKLDDREDVSGARVFDGEDQGKQQTQSEVQTATNCDAKQGLHLLERLDWS